MVWAKGEPKRLAAPMALFLCLLVGGCRPAVADQAAPLWEALRSASAFAMMRHAHAPGTGDPANFTLGDCATQRNLSEQGRRQAAAVGERFRRNSIDGAEVFASAWCRCRDTAELLGLGPVTTLPALNSFFAAADRREPQTAELRAWLAGRPSGRPLVLVTHQVNIQALTGSATDSGDTVVVARRTADGTILVLGTLRAPAGNSPPSAPGEPK
jgi:broad specificity phosphatase PhoE